MAVDPYISHTIWIGPMNKVHVPKEMWNGELTTLYSPTALKQFKKEIDALNNPKIQYKDHFLNILDKFNVIQKKH